MCIPVLTTSRPLRTRHIALGKAPYTHSWLQHSVYGPLGQPFLSSLTSRFLSVLSKIFGPEDRKMAPLRILVADDHNLMRCGIKALLEAHPGWQICGEANTGAEAVAKAEQLQPDIAILDITMPELNGIDAAQRIKKESPRTEVLILSVHYSDQIVREVAEAGVQGYVVKSDSDRDLAIAVETLARHKPFFTPLATQAVLNNLGKQAAATEAEPKESRI